MFTNAVDSAWGLRSGLEHVLPWLGSAALVLVLGWFVTTEEHLRRARRLVCSRAAFLVPMGLASLPLAIAVHRTRSPGWGDGPPLPADPLMELGTGAVTWLALLLVAVTLAGHVGLLEAHRDGRRPDGFAFWGGIRRHGPTLLVAKLALVLSVRAIDLAVERSGLALLLYLVPSVLLAPLPGIATHHPRRPLIALRETIDHAYRHLGSVGWRVTLLLLFCLGLLRVHGAMEGVEFGPELLIDGSSTLSWNHFPFALLPGPGALTTVLTAISVVMATISVTAHWLAVQANGAGPGASPGRQPPSSGASAMRSRNHERSVRSR